MCSHVEVSSTSPHSALPITTVALPPIERHLHAAAFVVLFRRLSIVVTHAVTDAGLGLLSNNKEAAVALRLRQHGSARPRDLQEMLGMTSGGVTRLVDRLVDAGLVRRVPPRRNDDGRGAPLTLTAFGRRSVDTFVRTVEQAHDDCRPIAKEALLHLEALGSGSSGPRPESREMLTSLARTSEALDRSIQESTTNAMLHEYQNIVLLSFAELEDGARPMALMELLGLSSGGVTKLVDRAVAAGLVRRDFGTLDDRRAVTIRVTRRGRTELKRALRGFGPHLDELWTAMHWIAAGRSPT
jgi:DNA-binding MarR family transcriptional regulator